MKQFTYNSETKSFSESIKGMKFRTVGELRKLNSPNSDNDLPGSRNDSFIITELDGGKLYGYLEHQLSKGKSGMFEVISKPEKRGDALKLKSPYGNLSYYNDEGFGIFVAGRSLIEKLISTYESDRNYKSNSY